MKNINLIYKLDGDKDKINNGLSVFELAPILLNVGELIKESNKTINPNGREIAINVKPFKKGSFIVDIVLFAQNNLQQIIDFVNTDEVRQIKELLEWVGITTGTGFSLFKLIKFLRGKPTKVEQIKPNEIRYTGEDGNSITVPNEVHQLFQNCNIQKTIYNSFAKPLEQEGINKIKTYISENEDTSNIIIKDDIEDIKNYSEAEIPTLDIKETVKNTMEVYLSPKRGSFDGDPRQWSFRMGGDEKQIITASIKDNDFLEKLNNGQIKPHYLDVAKVRLVQKINKVNNKLDPSSIKFEIEKVIEYQIGNSDIQTKMEIIE